MNKKKYDIIIPGKNENVNNKAMPLKPAPQQMQTKITTTSDKSKSEGGGKKK
jgi:hypothetical protein